MKAYFKLIRIQNIMIGIMAIFVSAYSIEANDLLLLLYCILSVVLAMSFGNVLNDILDLESDKISHPSRPLPSNIITPMTAKLFLIALFISLIITSSFLNKLTCLYLLFILLPLLILYNVYFKGIPIVGNIIVSVLLAFVLLFTELIFFNQIQIMWIPSLMVFGLSFIREFLKDIHDYDGDKEYNIHTFPVKIGVEKSVKIIKCLIIIFCLLLFIPYLTNFYQKNYLISLIILVEIPLIVLVSLLKKNPNKLILKQVSAFIKIISIFGLLVILIANN